MSELNNPETNNQSEAEKQRLLIKSRKELVAKSKEAFKVFAPMSTFLGFVGDIIKPLAPILHYLAAFFGIAAFILLILILIGRKQGKFFKMTTYFPHSTILAIVLTFFSLMGYGAEEGFFGANFDVVRKFQENVLRINPKEEESPKDDPKQQLTIGTLNNISIPEVDQHLDDIRERISLQKLADKPTDIRDYLVNAGIYYNSGNYNKADKMLQVVLTSGYIKLDLCLQFYEVLFTNLNGDEQAISKKLDSIKLSENEMMKVASIAFLKNGVDYYQNIEKTGLKDPILLAVALNLKARSLINDSHNFWQYQPYLVARWIPIWNANDKLLGKNIIKAKDYFFDYPKAYRKYLDETTEVIHENLLWRVDIHDVSNDLYVQRDAPKIWRRITSGEHLRSSKKLNIQISGTVADEDGNPMPEVVITDLDTHYYGSTEYNMTISDADGTFSITTGRNHLLRLEKMYDKLKYRETFHLAESENRVKFVMRKRD